MTNNTEQKENRLKFESFKKFEEGISALSYDPKRSKISKGLNLFVETSKPMSLFWVSLSAKKQQC